MQRAPLYGASAGQPRLSCKSLGVVMMLSAGGEHGAQQRADCGQCRVAGLRQLTR